MSATRILLVEDNPDDAELVTAALRRAMPDLVLVRVETEEDFLAALGSGTPDVVISDHNLPRFSGARALALARTHAPGTPFLLVTGSLDEETAVEYMRSGATDYLLKDRIARLPAAVAAAVAQARQRAALDWQQRLLHAVIDTAPSLIAVRDIEGRFVMANHAMAELYGTTPDALVGRQDADFNRDTEQVRQILRADREVLDTGQRRQLQEAAATTPSGQTRWYQTLKVPLTLPGDPRRMVLTVSTDVTDHRELEDQLRQAQKMEAIGQLAGGIAHDFNNVLTTILGLSQLMLADMPADHPHRSDIQEIDHSAQRAASLTRQLLAFSRRQVLQPQVLNLNELVERMDRFLRRLIGEDIDLRTQFAPGLWPVSADASQLEQVIMNLAVNARDAMPLGGKLTIETANVHLPSDYAEHHQPAATGPHVLLAVSDTGHGMDAATRARVFEPFFTTKGAGKGTGLGLSMVYGIVKQSGGMIWVYSEPGHGTTFKIYLPRAGDATEVQPSSAARPGDGSETLLLVEDDPSVRSLAARCLRARGYTVLEAGRPSEADRVLEAHTGPLHLLLTDVIMPEESGADLARRLTASRPDLKVLFVSGYTNEAVIHRGVMASHFAYLQKPFTPDSLADKVREVLDG